MSDIDVSCIVPCYNTGAFLDQALRSAEKNDRVKLEIIVLNDGSTDDSLSIMHSHATRDSRVRVIDKPNQGYGATVNRGFAEARGKYLAILEPDDYLAPHAYDKLYERAHEQADPDVVKAAYWRVLDAGTDHERQLKCAFYHRFPEHVCFTLQQQPTFLQYHPSIWSALYRADFIANHNIRFKEVAGGGWVDNPFMAETLAQAERIAYLDWPSYYYREDLPTSSSALKTASLAFERWNDMYDILEDLGAASPQVLRSLYVAGFTHARAAQAADALEVQALIGQMYGRMDPNLVGDIATLPNAQKDEFFAARGIEPHYNHGIYKRALVREFFYTIRANGLGYALEKVFGRA